MFGVAGVPGVLGGLDLLLGGLGVNGGNGGRLSVIHLFYAGSAAVIAPFDGCHIVAGMDFAMSAKAQDSHKRLTAFMTEFVFPAEQVYDRYRREAGPDDHTVPPVIEELQDTPPRNGGCGTCFCPPFRG